MPIYHLFGRDRYCCGCVFSGLDYFRASIYGLKKWPLPNIGSGDARYRPMQPARVSIWRHLLPVVGGRVGADHCGSRLQPGNDLCRPGVWPSSPRQDADWRFSLKTRRRLITKKHVQKKKKKRPARRTQIQTNSFCRKQARENDGNLTTGSFAGLYPAWREQSRHRHVAAPQGQDRLALRPTGIWQHMARTMERGMFDAMFIADELAPYNNYEGSWTQRWGKYAVQCPVHEPSTIVPILTTATTHIGVGVTLSTAFEHPYSMVTQALEPRSPLRRACRLEHRPLLFEKRMGRHGSRDDQPFRALRAHGGIYGALLQALGFLGARRHPGRSRERGFR